MKVSELADMALDYQVALAEGLKPAVGADPKFMLINYPTDALSYYPCDATPRPYSSDPALAIPIIERERIKLVPLDSDSGWLALHPACKDNQRGNTLTEAGMRAFVAAKIGDEVPT